MWLVRIISIMRNCLPDRITHSLFFFYLMENFFDKCLGIDTKRIISFSDEYIFFPKNMDSVKYEPTCYSLLFYITSYLKLSRSDIIIDLGCGCGRAIFFFATQSVKKIIGVEFDPNIFKILKKNKQTFHFNNRNIELCNMDVVHYKFIDENILFMFNPFGEKTMSQVLNNLEESLRRENRIVRIVYINPRHDLLFISKSWIKLLSLPLDLSSKNVHLYEAKLN